MTELRRVVGMTSLVPFSNSSLCFIPHTVDERVNLVSLRAKVQVASLSKSFEPPYPLFPLLWLGKIKRFRWLDGECGIQGWICIGIVAATC